MNNATRNTDPNSSHLAESDITTSGERQHQNGIALDVVILFPGLTSKELASHCPLDRYQLARRLNDLFIQNKVDKTDGKHGEQKWYRGSGKIIEAPEKPIEAFQQNMGNFIGRCLEIKNRHTPVSEIAKYESILRQYPPDHNQVPKIKAQIERMKR